MFMRSMIAATSLVATLGFATVANATTFVLDDAASTLEVTYVDRICGRASASCATLTGSFNSFSFDTDTDGADVTDHNLISWEYSGEGHSNFNVVATVVFSKPSGLDDGTTSGSGSFEISASFVGGNLTWGAPAEISVDPTHMLTVALGNFDNTGSTNFNSVGRFTYTEISNVPLPASVPLLIAGLGALGFVGRRKKAA